MTRAMIQWFGGWLSLPWLTGPILEKELRVSSRRRRNYVLRFGYVAALTLFVVLIWMSTVDRYMSGMYDPGRGSANAWRIQMMPEAGRTIIATIVWFQFCALQLLAAVLCSTSINEEIVRRTLGTLMTTPVNSFQIVCGKMLIKMLQVLLLLAISLPLLAVVRVFGGVPWDFLLSSLCVTVSAAILLGSASLYFSIRQRRAYLVIFATLVFGAVLYLLVPWLVFEYWDSTRDPMQSSSRWFETFLVNTNPFAFMFANTAELMRPGATRGLLSSWPLLCGILLGLSAIVLGLSTWVVRKAALRQSVGGGGFSDRRKARIAAVRSTAGGPSLEASAPEASIRRVRGSPVTWKELRTPLFRNRVRGIVTVAVAVLALVVTYMICLAHNELEDRETHVVYGIVFVILGLLETALLAAPTTITAEKEARSLALLLATNLSEAEIIKGKAIGILRRCAPGWAFLFGHVLVFSICGYIDPSALGHLAVMAAGVTALLVGSGLYFSARFRHTTTAVIMNLGLVVLLWVALPFILFMAMEIGHSHSERESLAAQYVTGNPVAQTGVVLDAVSGNHSRYWDEYDYPGHRSSYDWPTGHTGVSDTWAIIAGWAIVHALCGLGFAVLAGRRLRRSIE